jgi:hypothetical protein
LLLPLVQLAQSCYPFFTPSLSFQHDENRGADRPGPGPTFFNRLATLTKSIESPFLWIHKNKLKMMQAWPAWSARLFSTEVLPLDMVDNSISPRERISGWFSSHATLQRGCFI